MSRGLLLLPSCHFYTKRAKFVRQRRDNRLDKRGHTDTPHSHKYTSKTCPFSMRVVKLIDPLHAWSYKDVCRFWMQYDVTSQHEWADLHHQQPHSFKSWFTLMSCVLASAHEQQYERGGQVVVTFDVKWEFYGYVRLNEYANRMIRFTNACLGHLYGSANSPWHLQYLPEDMSYRHYHSLPTGLEWLIDLQQSFQQGFSQEHLQACQDALSDCPIPDDLIGSIAAYSFFIEPSKKLIVE